MSSRSAGHHAKINVNSVITEEEDKKYSAKAQDREGKLDELKQREKEGTLNERPKERPDQEL